LFCKENCHLINYSCYIVEHLQVCWHREICISPARGGRAFRNNEGRPLYCICQRRWEEQRQGWQGTGGFCVVLCQWRPCAWGFSGRSSALRCLFIILWESIKLICFSCDSLTRGIQQIPKGRERNTTWEEERVYNNQHHIFWYSIFWHLRSSNTLHCETTSHHENIIFTFLLSHCPGILRNWNVFLGHWACFLILLIGCYNIISWDVKILYHSCVECCTGLIVRLCIVPASV